MNDMSHPKGAARLSEDIGDVLSAIRRLIAEDEALDYARDQLQQVQSTGDAGNDLANRFGGPAALARKLVRDGAAALPARSAAHGAPPVFTEHPLNVQRRRLIADLDVPPARGTDAGLVASRDLPQRRATAPAVELPGLPPLRLGDSDRVDSTIFRVRGGADVPVAVPLREPVAREETEQDEFAEAFHAKARMRPDLPEEIAELRASKFETAEPDAGSAPADSGGPVEAAAGTADFWAAYLRAEEDVAAMEFQPASDGIDAAERRGAIHQELPEPPAMPIPVWLAGSTRVEEPVLPAVEDPADGSGDIVVEVVGAETDVAVEAASAAPSEPVGSSDPEPAADIESVDEVRIRAVIRDLIQEELHGELGQRFSRNLRAVIRREVANAIDDHLERI